MSSGTISIPIRPHHPNLPLRAAWRYLLHLLVHLQPIVLSPLAPLVLTHLLCSLNLCQQFLVGLIELVLVILIECLLVIIQSLVHWLQELVSWRLKSIFDRSCILVVITVHGELRGVGALVGVLCLRELDLHGRILAACGVVH